MSAIRPPVPSPLFPTQAPPPAPSPVRASRSDFFRAALEGTQAAGTAEPAPAPAPAEAARGGAPRWVEERLQRPGSLVDIRV